MSLFQNRNRLTAIGNRPMVTKGKRREGEIRSSGLTYTLYKIGKQQVPTYSTGNCTQYIVIICKVKESEKCVCVYVCVCICIPLYI